MRVEVWERGRGYSSSDASMPVPVLAQVMFDGPYGSCTLDSESNERALLISGGNEATSIFEMLVAGCCLRDRARG